MTEPKVVVIVKTPERWDSMVSGIPTQARAEAWGMKTGMKVVYWQKRLQRAYGLKSLQLGMIK